MNYTVLNIRYPSVNETGEVHLCIGRAVLCYYLSFYDFSIKIKTIFLNDNEIYSFECYIGWEL